MCSAYTRYLSHYPDQYIIFCLYYFNPFARHNYTINHLVIPLISGIFIMGGGKGPPKLKIQFRLEHNIINFVSRIPHSVPPPSLFSKRRIHDRPLQIKNPYTPLPLNQFIFIFNFYASPIRTCYED